MSDSCTSKNGLQNASGQGSGLLYTPSWATSCQVSAVLQRKVQRRQGGEARLRSLTQWLCEVDGLRALGLVLEILQASRGEQRQAAGTRPRRPQQRCCANEIPNLAKNRKRTGFPHGFRHQAPKEKRASASHSRRNHRAAAPVRSRVRTSLAFEGGISRRALRVREGITLLGRELVVALGKEAAPAPILQVKFCRLGWLGCFSRSRLSSAGSATPSPVLHASRGMLSTAMKVPQISEHPAGIQQEGCRTCRSIDRSPTSRHKLLFMGT